MTNATTQAPAATRRAKPTFPLRDKSGTPYGQAEFDPVLVQLGQRTERLALHRPSEGGEWRVSDPASGALLLKLQASFKGCPCSSAGESLAWARDAAKAQVPALAQRVGIDHFLAALDGARAKYGSR